MQPLHDVRVVSIALNAPGPLAVARLCAAGATVYKIEPPGGDPLQTLCEPWYRELHQGIDVRRLDLKTPDGRQEVLALLSSSDLFLSSQRPSALRRLGLDAATLLAPDSSHRHLRCLSIVGDTANPETPGHDLTYMAQAGLLGHEMPRAVFADGLAGERAFSAALLLLRQPPGSEASVGLRDSLEPLTASMRFGLSGRGALLSGDQPAYALYATRRGRVAVAALEPHFRARLYAALALPLDAPLTDVMCERTAAEWEAWARARDLPLCAVVEHVSDENA